MPVFLFTTLPHLIQAISQLHHRRSSLPTLRRRKLADLVEITKILNQEVENTSPSTKKVTQTTGSDGVNRHSNVRALGVQPGGKQNTGAALKGRGAFRVIGAAAATNACKRMGLVGDAARATPAKRSPFGFGTDGAAKRARLEGGNPSGTAAGKWSPRSEGAVAALKRARAELNGAGKAGRNGTGSDGTELNRSRPVDAEPPKRINIKSRFTERETRNEGGERGTNMAVEGLEKKTTRLGTGVESAGKERPGEDERARACWFAKQVWDEKKQHFVIRSGRVLKGPFAGKRSTRQSVYKVRYDDGREESTGLQKAQIFDENPFETEANKERKGGTGKGKTGAVTADGDAAVANRVTVDAFGKAPENNESNENGSGNGNGDENEGAVGGGKESGKVNGNGNGKGNGCLAKPWRALEVGWFLERLGAQFGASAQGFQKAWRDYETSALPDGVRIEYRPRTSGDRTDKYYIWGDPSQPGETFRTNSLVKLQQFFDEKAGGVPVRALCAALGRGCGGSGRARGAALSRAEVKEVRERMQSEGWRSRRKERKGGVTAGGTLARASCI